MASVRGGLQRIFELARMGLESGPAELGCNGLVRLCAKRPLDCSGSAGLVWAINGGWSNYIEIWAVIDLPVNRIAANVIPRNVVAAKIILP
jgi:hypothetical protein